MIFSREWCSVLLCGGSFSCAVMFKVFVAKAPEIEYFLCGVPLFSVVLLKVFLVEYPEIEFFLCGASFSSMVMLKLFVGENLEIEYSPRVQYEEYLQLSMEILQYRNRNHRV